MKRAVALAIMIVGTLCGCVNQSGARMGLFSASAPVLAVLYDDLFIGTAVGYIDRTGTIDIHSALNSTVRCVGEFRYTGSKTGTATVRCNDGAVAQMAFNALTALSGYGYGRTTRGHASFTFGLTPAQAAQYLTLPAGKKIVTKPSGPALVDL